MKVPKEIKEAIINCAKYNALAKQYDFMVREWLDEQGLSDDYGTPVEQYIECVEIGNSPKEFIELLENDFK